MSRTQPTDSPVPRHRRWATLSFVAAAILLAGGALYYQMLVKPTLTATRLEVRVAGSDGRLLIGVAKDERVTTIAGGQNELSEVMVFGDALFVRAAEVGVVAQDEAWIEVPLADLAPSFRALIADRVLLALDREVKDCRPPSSDARIVLNLFLKAQKFVMSGQDMCGSARYNTATEGDVVVTESEAVRPSELDVTPPSASVPLAQVTDPESVVGLLNALLDGP